MHRRIDSSRVVAAHEKAELEMLRESHLKLRKELGQFCSSEGILASLALEQSKVGFEVKQVLSKLADQMRKILGVN